MDSPPTKGGEEHRALGFGAAFGGAVLLALLFLLGGKGALVALATASPAFGLAGLGAAVFCTALGALRWGLLTNLLLGHSRISLWAYYRSFILSRAAGLVITHGAGDLALRPLLHRVSTSSSGLTAFSAVVIERVLDGWILGISAVASGSLILGLVGRGQFVLLLVALHLSWLVVFVIFTQKLTRCATVAMTRLARAADSDRRWLGYLSRGAESIATTLVAVQGERRSLTVAALLSVLRLAFIVAQYALVSQALGTLEIGPVEILAAIPAGQAALLLAVTPGGIGFVEGGLWAVLVGLGVSQTAVASFLLGQRLINSAYLLILAAAAYVLSLLWRSNR